MAHTGRSGDIACLVTAGIEEGRYPTRVSMSMEVLEYDSRNDNISGDQQCSFEVITPAVQHQEVDDKRSDEEGDRFEKRKVQRHVLVQDPAEDNDQRSYKDG